jgi:hypothetical protein
MFLAVIIFVIIFNISFFPILCSWLEKNFTVPNRLADFRSLFLTLGGALIASAAIAFSLVMFAMQVNVERIPHGLFRKFSTDIRLIASFIGILILAISISCASLIPDTSWIAAASLGSFWGVFLIFALFWKAYRRALLLISPIEQLRLLINDVKSEFRVWVRRAKRAAPLLKEPTSNSDVKKEPPKTTHDYPRLAYFQANPYWIDGAQRAIHYAFSFERRYAEHGDYEISAAAVRAIIFIHRYYIEAKGKTFFYNPPIFENPLSTDRFINNTLELLRQTLQNGISRRDEQQIRQTLQTMAALVEVYLGIDYSDEFASKTHAHLAAAYLAEAVQAVAPHNLPDVLMEGVRLIGQSAQSFLVTIKPELVTTLTDKIGLIACTGVANENYRPVTLTAIDQLTRLLYTLIFTDMYNIRFIVKNLEENVLMVAKLFLKVPDTPLLKSHSAYLAPYYSCTSMQSLQSWLTDLVNAVSKVELEDEKAKIVIRNIETWADGLYRNKKELLLLAIEKRSSFTFDIIHWIAHVTKVLMALSNTPACDDYRRDKLRKHALWLISTFSWIPDENETVSLVDAYNLTETLFDVAVDAYHRDCEEIYEDLKKLLLEWAFKGGRYQTGWGTLERTLYGLVTLSLVENSYSFEAIKRQITDRLSQVNAPDQEIRDDTAREIRRKAATLYREGHWFSRIEYEMSQLDRDKVKSALEEIANILSPDTADEPVHILF